MVVQSHAIRAGTTLLMIVCAMNASPRAPSIKLSEVASATELAAEISATVIDIEKGLASRESFRESASKLRRSAAQMAVFAQALAQHDHNSKFKKQAPQLRDVALQFANSNSYDEALLNLTELQQAIEGSRSISGPVEYDWSKLASLRTLMDSLRERTDLVRKGLRRSRDPVSESRHASMMAVLALAVDAHSDRFDQAEKNSDWHTASGNLQQSMTKTAVALRNRAGESALESFTAAQEACDRCHETFKR